MYGLVFKALGLVFKMYGLVFKALRLVFKIYLGFWGGYASFNHCSYFNLILISLPLTTLTP